MVRLLVLLFSISVIFMGCTGEESTEVDRTPPYKPDLLHHLGDSGDGGIVYDIDYPEGPQQVIIEDLNDDNNGIDAVAGGDWIRLQWAPFADSDVDVVKIWRYRETAFGIDGLVTVDTVRASEGVTYLDTSLDDPENTAINNQWFYYLDAYDTSGNHTISDTVSYYLCEKASPIEPAYSQEIASSDLSFTWRVLSSGSVSMYRVMLFDENGSLIWWYNENDTDPESGSYLTVNYNGNILFDGTYWWRVDAFGEFDPSQVSGSGSESNEIEFYIQ